MEKRMSNEDKLLNYDTVVELQKHYHKRAMENQEKLIRASNQLHKILTTMTENIVKTEDSKTNLRGVPTCELVEELKEREGVTEMPIRVEDVGYIKAFNNNDVQIRRQNFTGPAIVLTVID